VLLIGGLPQKQQQFPQASLMAFRHARFACPLLRYSMVATNSWYEKATPLWGDFSPEVGELSSNVIYWDFASGLLVISSKKKAWDLLLEARHGHDGNHL
jgi:hypothetical protein